MDFTALASDVQIDAHHDVEELQPLGGSPFLRGFVRTPDMRIMFRVPRWRVDREVMPHGQDEHRLDVGDTRYTFIITEMSIDAGRDLIDFHGRVTHRNLIPAHLSTLTRVGGMVPNSISVRSAEDLLRELVAADRSRDDRDLRMFGVDTSSGADMTSIRVVSNGTVSASVASQPAPAKNPPFHAPWGRMKRALNV